MEQQKTFDGKAVLLVGGLGTRLRSVVPSLPKPLAMIGSQSFLELLIMQLRSQGIRRLVMCTGYLGDQVEEKLGDGRHWDVEIEYSRESIPLGTAGAIKLAEPYLQAEPEFVIMNGDSFLELDLRELIRFHRNHAGLVSMAVVRVNNAGRYGTVQMDDRRRVIGFSEKTGSTAAGTVNGGVYIFDRSVLEYIPEGPASLERDVFPQVLQRGVYGLEQDGMFIDIGTPEDFWKAQSLHDRLCAKALQVHGHVGSEVA